MQGLECTRILGVPSIKVKHDAPEAPNKLGPDWIVQETASWANPAIHVSVTTSIGLWGRMANSAAKPTLAKQWQNSFGPIPWRLLRRVQQLVLMKVFKVTSKHFCQIVYCTVFWKISFRFLCRKNIYVILLYYIYTFYSFYFASILHFFFRTFNHPGKVLWPIIDSTTPRSAVCVCVCDEISSLFPR